MADSPLVLDAKANDVVMVSDRDHRDESAIAYVGAQLPGLAKAGVRHLYLEHDPREVRLGDIIATNRDNSYGKMVMEAQRLGIEIHLYDDRREARALDARFPQAAAFAGKHDPYLENRDGLIAHAPDPKEMRAYLSAQGGIARASRCAQCADRA
ncbi:MAG: hypothetical protein WDN72_11360 [Alphaproteobacteria bacterium]